jgi:Fic family protein
MSGLTEYSEKRINTFLEYLEKGHDNPIIQAGIAQIQVINITPFDNGNGRVARLLSYLFLYKHGYDVRGMISFEEYLRRDMITFKRVLDLTKAQGSLTLWLEYFAFAVMTSLEKTVEIIKNLDFQEELPASFWKLNSRQRQILEYLEEPGLEITNKEVQKVHGISQITASRDLAKLTNLGLLLAHGKGRSVYYTRV